MRRTVTLLAILGVFAFPLGAQPAKKALTQADWDQWRSISGAVLSRDGQWAAYTLIPQVGDGELVVQATDGSRTYRVPRGYLGRPNNTPGGLRPPAGGPEDEPGDPVASPAQFSADSRFVVVMVQPSRREVEQLEAQRDRPRGGAGRARSSLAILSLADGQVTVIPGVRSFRLPRDHGTWVAYLAEPDSVADSTGTVPGARPAAARRGRGRTYGSPLLLRNLATGIAERFNDVLGFALDDSAKALAYTVASRDSTRDGAFFRSLRNGTTVPLATARGTTGGSSWMERPLRSRSIPIGTSSGSRRPGSPSTTPASRGTTRHPGGAPPRWRRRWSRRYTRPQSQEG